MSDYPINGEPGNLTAQSVTIPNGASVSEMITTQGMAVVGVVMPSAWTAACIGFEACLSGNASDLVPVLDAGGNPEGTSANATVSTFIAFPSADAIFAPFLAVTSHQSGALTAVAQGAARTIILLLRKFLS